MNKNCSFCQSARIKKHGTQNNTQRYFCNECYKSFTLKNKLDPIKIWNDYILGKQTYKELAIKYHYGYDFLWALFWHISFNGLDHQ